MYMSLIILYADPKIMELRAKSRFLIMHADCLTKSCMYMYGKKCSNISEFRKKILYTVKMHSTSHTKIIITCAHVFMSHYRK